MDECVVCPLCEAQGLVEDAEDRARVRSNVRRFAHERFTVWRCRSCGSLHVKEAIDLATYYAGYPVHGHEIDFWDRRAYPNLLRRLRRAGLERRHKILDHGCGTGQFVRFLRERGYPRVRGWDAFSPGWQDRAALEERYDLVISQDVIEHAEDPRAMLRELAALVAPGGLLCVGTPNADGIDLGDLELSLDPLHAPYHRHILSERALVEALEELGLERSAIYRRSHYDTLVPTCNYRFLNGYVRRGGNFTDVAFEPPRPALVLGSPTLLAYALLGSFFPLRCHMMVLSRRPLPDSCSR